MMCKLLWFALSITSFTAPAAQQKDERPVYSQRPLQVDLIAPLDVGKLSPGSPIFAKARVEWNTATCHMRAGATVSGHTVEVVRHSKTSKGSSLTVLFDTADCDGHATQIPFNLFAVVAAFRAQQDILLSDYGVFGAASTAPHVGGGGKIDPHAAVQMDRNQDFAVTAAGKPVDLPAVIQSRQVFFQRNLFLGVGTGLDGGSTLSSPHGKFRIETGSQFVLMPKLVLSSEAVAAIASAKPSLTSAESARYPETKSVSAPLSPPKSEIDETDICSASCTVASLSDASLGSAKAESTISSDSLGYVPHENGEFSALNHEAALVYLSADNLLFTFDLHKLRHRYPDGVRTETMRTVRAVLIDPASHAVKRVSDWEVQGTGQYIWPISQGSVLVHRGHSLYLMNSNLDPSDPWKFQANSSLSLCLRMAAASLLEYFMNVTLPICTIKSPTLSEWNRKKMSIFTSTMKTSSSCLSRTRAPLSHLRSYPTTGRSSSSLWGIIDGALPTAAGIRPIASSLPCSPHAVPMSPFHCHKRSSSLVATRPLCKIGTKCSVRTVTL